MLFSEVVKVVGKVVSDCSRRKRNVIISGISENSHTRDQDTISDLFESILRIDAKNKIITTKRLGMIKPDEPNFVRRILVVLDSESTADEILRRTYLLKGISEQCSGNYIYINRDLSPEDSKTAYERRKHRREQRGAGSLQHTTARAQDTRASRTFFRTTDPRSTQETSDVAPSPSRRLITLNNTVAACTSRIDTTGRDDCLISTQSETERAPTTMMEHQPSGAVGSVCAARDTSDTSSADQTNQQTGRPDRPGPR